MESVFSNIYEYSIFTCKRFKEPNQYIICRRFKHLKWYEKLIFNNEWNYLGLDGKTNDMKPFRTEDENLIREYLNWNIKNDNNEL